MSVTGNKYISLLECSFDKPPTPMVTRPKDKPLDDSIKMNKELIKVEER
jgi:hypothetical protein